MYILYNEYYAMARLLDNLIMALLEIGQIHVLVSVSNSNNNNTFLNNCVSLVVVCAPKKFFLGKAAVSSKFSFLNITKFSK